MKKVKGTGKNYNFEFYVNRRLVLFDDNFEFQKRETIYGTH
jgi:hypothetical protein